MNKVFSLLKKHIQLLMENVLHPDRLTYYPEEPRHNRLKILAEQLVWLLRFQQVNEYYYILGLDRKNRKNQPGQYISGRTCQTWIAKKKKEFAGNAKEYDILLYDKFLSNHYIESLKFPVPRAIALIHRNQVILPESGEVLPLAYAVLQREELFRDCICKPVTGFGGRGVFHVMVDKGVFRMNGKIVDANSLNDVLSRETYLIQERIAQHEKMSRLNPSSVNTIRLVTCYRGETIEPFSAGVRLGREGNVTDNWHKGGIIIRLDMASGKLDPYGFTLPEFSRKKYDRHPDTGVRFEGFEVPYYRQAIHLAVQLHRYFYCTYSIGWDIAITPSGPLFIEGNYGWDPYVHVVIEDHFLDLFSKFFG